MRKILLKILAVFVLAAANYPTYAQDWEQSNGPNGGAISGLTILGNSTYASIGSTLFYKEAGGIFKTDDNGLNWIPMNTGLLNTNIKTVYTKDTVLFAGAIAGSDAAEAGVFRSFNGGQTWESCGLTSQTISSLIHQGDYIFAGTAGGVYRSSDNGNTWVVKNTGLASGGVQDFAKNDTYLYVVKGSSVHRSVNFGDTWTAINTGLPGFGPFKWVETIASKGDTLYVGTRTMTTTQDGIYRSTNSGSNWTLTGLSNVGVNEVFTKGNDVYAALPGIGVKKSSDNGTTWNVVNLPIGQNSFIANTENIFSGNGTIGVFRSVDDGQNWNLVDNGMRGQCIRTLGANSNTIFSGTALCGVYKTTDNGQNWVASNNGININTNTIQTLDVFGPNIFITAYSSTLIPYRSNDNGENWTVLNLVDPPQNYAAIGDTIFASSYVAHTYEDTLQIWRSFDAGVTWELTPGVGNGIQQQGLLTTIGTNLFLFTNSKVYRSVDNADSWTEISNLNGAYNVTVCNSILFCSTTSGIFKSDDLGNTWTYANFAQQAMHLVSNGNKVFAEIDREIYVSTNYGESWVRIDNETIASTSIFPYVYGYALAATNDFIFTGVGHKSVWKSDFSEMSAPAQPGPITGSDTPCIGSTVTYSVANVSGVTYTWQFPADWTVLGGAGTNEVTVEIGTQSGIIIVTPSNPYGTGPSQTLSVTPVPVVPADVSITADNNPSCPGFDVTFTAIPVNGGSPFYEWYVNGLSVGTNQATYSYIPDNNDQVYVVMTSDLSCISDNPATSNTITMVLSDLNPVSVSITADQNDVCVGTQVIFTATPVNGGNPSYQWYVNGSTIGSDQDTFTYTPDDGDQVYVVMTSDLGCVSDNPATSNTISMLVNDLLPVNASIVADQNDVCDGTQVTFTATPVNGGNPSYQWYVNGSTVGSDQDTFTYTPADGEQVYVVMTSDLGCVSDNPATSNTVTMIVNDILPVSVSLVADQNNVCEGTIVSFFPIPVEGGSSPTYEWYVSGTFAANGDTYSYVPSDGDQVYVIMTSSLACVSGNPAQSNTLLMQVSPYIDVTASIAITQNNLCEGSEFNFTSSTTGGGNTPQYQWQVNGATTGENTPEFAYVAENGDVVSMVFTSDLTCTNGNPVTSNTITAVANPLPVVTWPGFEPDTLCIEDWGPVTLTGGTPEGGTYSGDGVVDNIFDPTLAGTGTHEITYTYSDPSGCSNQSSLFLFVDVCLGMSEKESGLLVYPNPVSDNLMVKMQDNSTLQQITLTNMLGIRVYQIENPDSNEVVSIPVQNLPSGNYLLRVISESKFAFKMVVIK